MSTKGTRHINGKFYLLCGRVDSKERAEAEATAWRADGYLVRIIKLWDYDYLIYSFPKDKHISVD